MCFSATASFAVGGALVPLGAFALARARHIAPAWMLFAAYPLAFGLQQLTEGAVWLGVEGGDAQMVAVASRGFLFFSHLFWPAFVPLSVWYAETDPRRRRVAAVLAVAGLAYGLSIALPSILFADWLRIEVVQRSLEYHTRLIYDGVLSRTALRIIYAAVVVGSLMLASDWRIRVFGVLVLASLALTYGAFAHAFISIWCFFAAILSVYLIAMMPGRQAAAGPRGRRYQYHTR